MKTMIQKEKGFYVYYVDRRGYAGPHFTTLYFQDLSQLFSKFMEWQIVLLFRDWDQVYAKVKEDYSGHYWCNFPVAHYACFDETGRWYSSNNLIGLYRKWRAERSRLYYCKTMVRRNGRKRAAYGSFRYPHTMQEMRNYYVDPDARELGINVRMRAARSVHNIPNAWDDQWAHNEKCWKQHRKNQWKM